MNQRNLISGLQEALKNAKPAPQREDSLVTFMKTLLQNITMLKGDKGDTGPQGQMGLRGFRGEKGDSITGPRGPEGKPGKDGYTPKKGVDYLDGKDGTDAEVDYPRIERMAERPLKEHETRFDHALIHDPKMLGPLELGEYKEGDILQVQGGKLVGVELPKPQRPQQQWMASQGVSNVRSFTVTSSQALDAIGIYVIDATAGNVTITVPTAQGRENHWFELIRIDGSANTVTVVPSGSETMSGMTDYVLQQWSDVKIFAYNSNYLIRQAS